MAPFDYLPFNQGFRYSDLSDDLPDSQSQVTGSPQAQAGRSPGSVLPTFKEATGSTRQKTSFATVLSVQVTFADSQLSSVSNLSRSLTAGAPLSTLPSSSTASRGDAGSALQDHRDLVTSFPLNVSELNAVSECIEEVEMTHIPIETPSVNPFSQGVYPAWH